MSFKLTISGDGVGTVWERCGNGVGTVWGRNGDAMGTQWADSRIELPRVG
jgi:hypothetical protein